VRPRSGATTWVRISVTLFEGSHSSGLSTPGSLRSTRGYGPTLLSGVRSEQDHPYASVRLNPLEPNQAFGAASSQTDAAM
jgi:hypothetical protein